MDDVDKWIADAESGKYDDASLGDLYAMPPSILPGSAPGPVPQPPLFASAEDAGMSPQQWYQFSQGWNAGASTDAPGSMMVGLSGGFGSVGGWGAGPPGTASASGSAASASGSAPPQLPPNPWNQMTGSLVNPGQSMWNPPAPPAGGVGSAAAAAPTTSFVPNDASMYDDLGKMDQKVWNDFTKGLAGTNGRYKSTVVYPDGSKGAEFFHDGKVYKKTPPATATQPGANAPGSSAAAAKKQPQAGKGKGSKKKKKSAAWGQYSSMRGGTHNYFFFHKSPINSIYNYVTVIFPNSLHAIIIAQVTHSNRFFVQNNNNSWPLEIDAEAARGETSQVARRARHGLCEERCRLRCAARF